MSDDQQQQPEDPDTAPDVTDPELDEFTATAAPDEQPKPKFYKVPVDADDIQLLQRVFGLALSQLIERKPDIGYFEVLIALQNYFLHMATKMLAAVTLDEFEPNRFEVLSVIGIAAGCVNVIKPTAEQLEAANLGPTLH